ncbi:glycerophosphodiester phosphodiesterase [Halomonas sp. TBZ9]|uniref:Glycerophosphodiester phosphodiesterase n=1 Tax=Vreelandella azerica TaxID=2732867 RepID=A0A7Y3TZM5_9GAMM|nr:glycerophosphodiester phosphodiesterase family protein [Halomonas azerica]NOG31609.1 glycerophosphodiester phosphodiesterase [Halomonas azerica]
MPHFLRHLPWLILVTATANADTEALEQQYTDLESFQVIAHRGASGNAPESTLPALELAHRSGADYLELDIQLSADGHLVAFHDRELQRTSNGEGRINDFDLETLQQLDTGSWFNAAYPDKANEGFVGLPILSLEEVFKRFGHDARYYLETKAPDQNPGLEAALVDMLERFEMIADGRVIVQSFSRESLLALRDLRADLPLVQLLWLPADDMPLDLEALGDITDYALGVGVNFRADEEIVLTENFIETAQTHGLKVHVYTVNEQEDMQTLIDWRADGLFTDYPERLLELTE